MTAWLVVTAAAAATVAVAMVATAGVARRVGRVSVVDVTWGLGFVAVAAVSVAVGAALGRGDRARALLVLALVAAWGLRLAWHIGRRSRGHGEDPRYTELLGSGGPRAAVRKVFVPQGAVLWVVSLPLQVAAVTAVRWWAVVGVGVLVWLIGMTFEVVGDAQLTSYRRLPREQRPPVLDTGLWGWTRHPNYFGDACCWWGLWLVGGLAGGWTLGLATLVSPVLMTHALRNVTGAKLLERSMSRREGWQAYAARVPLFFPRPPRG